ncbi:MAG: hypothetical protein RLZZ387_413 [Chloroflexota bacterium]|jgi:pimeloyl-ACP methyl ester carboxylesterase
MTNRVEMRHLVILLPGIMGSALQKDGKDLWALSGQALWQHLRAMRAGGLMKHLRLEDDDWQRDDLGDGVVAERLIEDLHSIPGLTQHAGYSVIARRIPEYFEVTPGSVHAPREDANFYTFPYDWRRDNRATARKLQAFVAAQLPRWRAWSGAKDAQVILIAHSMGGLVSRYYLEALGGWRDCRALITVGTPHRGALGALDTLSNGVKKMFIDLSDVVRSFQSVYQLLPTYPAVEVGGEFRRVAELDSIPNVVQARAKAAREEFHEVIRTAALANRALPGYRQCTMPWVGTRQDTLQSATLASGKLALGFAAPARLDAKLADGDGTVPRVSAVPADLDGQRSERFAVEQHGWLMNNEMTLEPLLDTLVQIAARGAGDLHGEPESQRPALNLRLDPVALAGEPAEVRLALVSAVHPYQLDVQVEPVGADGTRTTRDVTVPPDVPSVLELEGLAPGLYRVIVRARASVGGAGALPSRVHGVFEVVDPAADA